MVLRSPAVIVEATPPGPVDRIDSGTGIEEEEGGEEGLDPGSLMTTGPGGRLLLSSKRVTPPSPSEEEEEDAGLRSEGPASP